MRYDYSENILVQESAEHLLERELGWQVAFAYSTEQLGKDGTFGRTNYREILLNRYFRQALQRLNPWLTTAQLDEAKRRWKVASPRPPSCRSTKRSTPSSETVFPLLCSSPTADLKKEICICLLPKLMSKNIEFME